MATVSVSLSTSQVPGPSNPIALNHRSGRPVAWFLTTNSSVAIADVQVQACYDDLQTSVNSSIFPPVGSLSFLSSANVVWGGISSNAYLTMATSAAPIHFGTSAIFADGIQDVFLASPCGLRLFSSASSSNVLTLKAVFADGG
jgi:hypothetical protein